VMHDVHMAGAQELVRNIVQAKMIDDQHVTCIPSSATSYCTLVLGRVVHVVSCRNNTTGVGRRCHHAP
jgi:hypothetical protein